jgi:hypothetical protein
MQKFWTAMLWQLVKRIVGDASLCKNIMELCAAAFATDVAGAEKRARVLAELADIRADLASIGNWAVNLCIEAAVAWLRARADEKAAN